MNKIVLTVLLCLTLTLAVSAQRTRYQRGYQKANGTYVLPHYKTHINRTNHDNFSTQGNINFYTGSYGTRARDYSSGAYNYGNGKTIRSGSRGAHYYVNDRGRKVYVPKRK
ncbi:hypothetical protein ACILE2_07550 [Capnocytophaga canimorsus]|uniref:hypothetical protein n=1 Tax=Capnocytophaga canimorsus TaxID=28188 RepID=UPI0037D5E1FB